MKKSVISFYGWIFFFFKNYCPEVKFGLYRFLVLLFIFSLLSGSSFAKQTLHKNFVLIASLGVSIGE